MAVSTTDFVYSYTGNGGTTAFSFPAKLLAQTDVRVYLETGVATDVFTLKTISTHYTVSFDSDAETCTVTFLAAPTNGYRVGITRETPRTQGTNLDREGRSPAKTVEGMVDKATMLAQEAIEKTSRAPLFRVFPVDPDPVDIDPLEDRRALIAQDNGDGTWTLIPSTNDPDELAIDAAASAAAAAASESAAAASEAAALAAQTAAEFAQAAIEAQQQSGLASAKPVAPATRVEWYSTDTDTLEIWRPEAGRWFVIG